MDVSEIMIHLNITHYYPNHFNLIGYIIINGSIDIWYMVV